MSRDTQAQFITQLLSNIVSDILEPAPKKLAQNEMSKTITYTQHKDYGLKQGKCYQQYSNNLCGYHALYNTFCFVNLINDGKSQYDINNGAHFWMFKCQIKQFLLNLKEQEGFGEEWPWSTKDIQEGDFQRIYYQLCLQKMEKFEIFRNPSNINYISQRWCFQYNNLILDNESRDQLSNNFQKFRFYSGQKTLVLHMILQITTHWLTFFAVNRNGKRQYWFFDSENDEYLSYNWQQIQDYIEKASKEQALVFGRRQFTKFQKQSNCVCVRDIQTSLRLIVSCLQGLDSLQNYEYNQRYRVFANPLEKALSISSDQTQRIITEYWVNIKQFLIQQIQWQILKEQNRLSLRYISESVQKIKNSNEDCYFLYELTRFQYDIEYQQTQTQPEAQLQ